VSNHLGSAPQITDCYEEIESEGKKEKHTTPFPPLQTQRYSGVALWVVPGRKSTNNPRGNPQIERF